MSYSDSPSIIEVIGVKHQGGPPTNSGPVAIASGIPAVMSDSSVVPGVFGSPEDVEIMVVDRGSKRGRTGRKVCYALLTMIPLSISCAEGFVVISCGKVDYDKSG
jgi:hypothetical protein